MPDRQMTRDLTLILLASVVMAINTFLAGRDFGVEQGYREAWELTRDASSFSAQGGTNWLGSSHLSIAYLMAGMIIGVLLRKRIWISAAVCSIAVAGASFIYVRFAALLATNTEFSFSENFVRHVAFLDVVSLVLLVLITAGHIHVIRQQGH